MKGETEGDDSHLVASFLSCRYTNFSLNLSSPSPTSTALSRIPGRALLAYNDRSELQAKVSPFPT